MRGKYTDLKILRNHDFFKDINWDALLAYKIKPPFVPSKAQRINESNLNNISSPFVKFMSNEGNENKITVTLKTGNMNQINNLTDFPNNWFENF